MKWVQWYNKWARLLADRPAPENAYEPYTTKALANDRERKLKRYGRGLVELKKRIGFG